jgi:16S rRNA processing protein RimM
MEGWLRAGRVGRPHGLDGSFLVGEAVPALLRAGAQVRVGTEQREIVRRAGHDRRVILRLDGCADRQAVRALHGRELFVARDSAPQLGPEEWWAEDLEGCQVRDGATVLGVVARLLALPSCEALEVLRPGGGAPLLVPLVCDAVRSVDVARRTIEVDRGFLGES